MDYVKDLWQQYRSLHGANCKRPDRMDFLYRNYFGEIAAHPLAKLQRPDVRKWFRATHAAHGTVAANRSLGLLRAMINWAIREEVLDLPGNPAVGVQALPEKARERFMLPEESIRLRKALDGEPTWRDYFYLLLCTGARRANVLSMRWEEIDTTLRVWVIPAKNFKTGRTHHVPLTAPALAVLERRKREVKSEWVFPARDPARHLANPQNAWVRICRRANITGLRIHDLRRSLASYMAMDGSSLLLIGAALGHADPRSTAIYARLGLNPIREAMDKAGQSMLG